MKIYIEFIKVITLFPVMCLIILFTLFIGNIYLNIFLVAFSSIIVLRFFLNVFFEKEFNSYSDLLVGIFYTIISINYILSFSSEWIKTQIINKTNSYIFEIFILNICLLIRALTLIMLFIYLKVVIQQGAKFLDNYFKDSLCYCIVKELIVYIKRRVYKEVCIPLYKNSKAIKNIFIVTYVIVGIYIISYLPNLDVFNFMGSEIEIQKLNQTILKNDIENYRIIFVTPLIGMMLKK